MDEGLEPRISDRLDDGVRRLEAALAKAPDPDAFSPEVPDALRAAGLHLLTVSRAQGGLGATLPESVQVLAAVGAVDGSAALGLAMQVQVVGSAAEQSLAFWSVEDY